MSISAQRGQKRRQPAAGTGKKPARNKPAGSTKAPGGTGRPPVKPVRAGDGPAWGPIAAVAAVAALALAILGYGTWAVVRDGRSWQDRASDIEGIVNFREKDPKMLQYEQHTQGPLAYRVRPAVGGTHNNDWQNCVGDVYDAPIAQEHAVHSLEHGAVWITYRPELPKDQVEKLASRVRGKEKMMMSPFKDLDSPISLQAWGFQLKVQNADDERIDEFVKTLRVNASIEGANASCSQGITATGDTPRDLEQQQPQQPQMQQPQQ